jgi:single-stranded DNA-binding protein
MTIECAFFGTVGRDAEAKTSKNGRPYLRFSAREGDGDAAQWITVMYFGQDAAELAPEVQKGARVYVEGSLRLDSWEQQDGTQRTGLTVMSFHCRPAKIGRHRQRKPDDDGRRDQLQHHPANDVYSEGPF